MSRRKGAWSEKAFKDALRVSVQKNVAGGGGKRLMRLADVLVAKGLDGDVMAIKEIADRLDGKPHQTQDIAVTDERSVIRAPETSEDADAWQASHKPH